MNLLHDNNILKLYSGYLMLQTYTLAHCETMYFFTLYFINCLQKGVHWTEICQNFANRLQKDEHFTEINNIHRHEKVQCSHFPAKKVKVGQVSKLSLVDTLSCFLTLVRLGLNE